MSNPIGGIHPGAVGVVHPAAPRVEYPNLGQGPLVYSQWWNEQAFFDRGGTVDIPVPGVRHIYLANRLARDVLATLRIVEGQQQYQYIVDRGSTVHLNQRAPVFGVTLYDLYLSNTVNPLGEMFGTLEGTRNDESLPWYTYAPSGAATAPRRGGGMLITACSEPVDLEIQQRQIVSKINYAQERIAAGTGAVTMDAVAAAGLETAAGATSRGGVGYFQFLHALNSTASAYTVRLIPVGANNASGLGSLVTIDAGASLSIGVEAAHIVCNFTGAGQHVIAWQSVALNMAGEP